MVIILLATEALTLMVPAESGILCCTKQRVSLTLQMVRMVSLELVNVQIAHTAMLKAAQAVLVMMIIWEAPSTVTE